MCRSPVFVTFVAINACIRFRNMLTAGCSVFRELLWWARASWDHISLLLRPVVSCQDCPSVHSQTPFHFIRMSLLGSSGGSMSLALFSSFFSRKCSCCFVAEREVVFSLWSVDPDGPVMICASKTNLETTGNSLLEFHVRTPKIPRHRRSGNTKIDIENLNTERKKK